MKRRDILIGLVILAVLAAVIYFVRRPKPKVLELPTPTTEEKIEDKFNVQIPEGVDKAELEDVSGGNASGIATRKFENGKFTLTVLADLPDPASGSYQVKLVKGDGSIPLGQMRIAKGGYLLEFNSSTDYSDYNKVLVTLGEKSILEGSF